jgi:hypothetical protein
VGPADEVHAKVGNSRTIFFYHNPLGNSLYHTPLGISFYHNPLGNSRTHLVCVCVCARALVRVFVRERERENGFERERDCRVRCCDVMDVKSRALMHDGGSGSGPNTHHSRYPRPLTPHPSPLTLHPLPLNPHPSPVNPLIPLPSLR